MGPSYINNGDHYKGKLILKPAPSILHPNVYIFFKVLHILNRILIWVKMNNKYYITISYITKVSIAALSLIATTNYSSLEVDIK